jgi:hypothetical protein
MVLVLDQSGSLRMANAWDDVQDAAKEFVAHFDDEIDQLGMVSFNVRAAHHFQIRQPFLAQARTVIDGMHSDSYTNTGEGLRLAYDQFQAGTVRERSAKVVVFFTDGRPTAFRGNLGGEDRVLAGWNAARPTGFWDNPETVVMDPSVSPRARNCNPWWPYRNCWGYFWTSQVLDKARDNGLYWADKIRDDNVFVYTIGMGDTSQPPGSILQIDQNYLRQLANEDGIADPSQPDGKMYYVPDATQLRRVFNQVASDLLARLAQ